jgi:hypothetical protein
MSVWKQKASKGKGDGSGFEKAPPGNHPAVLVAIVDMGTQSQEYAGQQKWQRRAYFVWELVTEKMSGTKDRNHLIAIDLTVSLNEKAKLRKWIEARAGKAMPEGTDYDILKELGKPCLLTVVEKESNGNKYPKIEGVTAVPKGVKVDPPQNQPFSWSLDDYEKEGTVEIPDWVESLWLYGEPISEHIKRCREITDPDNKESPDETVDADAAMAEGKTSTGEPIPW